MEEDPNMPPQAKAGKPGKVAEALTPQEKNKKPSSTQSCGWREIMDMEIPATQSASEAEPALEEMATGEEGLGALGESPVPPRKRDLKAKMKETVSAKSPVKKPAAMLKKPAAVSKFGNRKDNMAAAGKLLKMLEDGKPLAEVLKAKQNL